MTAFHLEIMLLYIFHSVTWVIIKNVDLDINKMLQKF